MSAAERDLCMWVQNRPKCIQMPYDSMLIATHASAMDGYHPSLIKHSLDLSHAAWLEACTPSQLFTLKAEFDYKVFFLRVLKPHLVHEKQAWITCMNGFNTQSPRMCMDLKLTPSNLLMKFGLLE